MNFDCYSFCTGDTYDIDPLAKTLREKGLDPKFYDNVIYIHPPSENEQNHIFFFPYGCVVFWGVEPSESQYYLDIAKQHVTKPIPRVITDQCFYYYGVETSIIEESDELILEPGDPLVLLSFSYALSQSVKLTAFEESIDNIIQKTKHLPEEMAQKGTTSLSRRKLSKSIGVLFAERHSINLHNDLLDTPEFFWRRPAYEPYYQMGITYLDISTRTNILNQRLAALHELYQVLSDELKHLHSSRLELIIIYLIVTEVILVIVKDILKLV
ncbi:RMD1 family protein [Candidatus Paracaedibacter symbiosus]|uniref:RMD1 family protein n=1 Tax=Candidatus Paracaedibacter symbiosus TaxID=244582 RepID=UPI0006907F37|nr:RMD1 family protein [Candidatus Paracaedibacter symbiosus]